MEPTENQMDQPKAKKKWAAPTILVMPAASVESGAFWASSESIYPGDHATPNGGVWGAS